MFLLILISFSCEKKLDENNTIPEITYPYDFFMNQENSKIVSLIFIALLQATSAFLLFSFIHLEGLISRLKMNNLF